MKYMENKRQLILILFQARILLLFFNSKIGNELKICNVTCTKHVLFHSWFIFHHTETNYSEMCSFQEILWQVIHIENSFKWHVYATDVKVKLIWDIYVLHINFTF